VAASPAVKYARARGGVSVIMSTMNVTHAVARSLVAEGIEGPSSANDPTVHCERTSTGR
jgi:hypothetical protein